MEAEEADEVLVPEELEEVASEEAEVMPPEELDEGASELLREL